MFESIYIQKAEIMNEYKKQFLGESVKGIAAAIVGAIILWASQQWLVGDLEYQKAYKNSYLYAPLGQQGLTMAFNGKPLKNISVVEFAIYNRTQKQLNNTDLIFSINETESSPRLVSGGIITPDGIPQSQAVEEIQTQDPFVKKFRIKILPKQKKNEYYHAVFVFDGEKAPEMSIISASNGISIIEYQTWKETVFAISILIVILVFVFIIMVMFFSLIDFFTEPKRHKKNVERFVNFAEELKKEGQLDTNDPKVIDDIKTIYAAYTEPKESKFWSKVFGAKTKI